MKKLIAYLGLITGLGATWVLPENQLKVGLIAGFLSADKFYNPLREKVDINRFTETSGSSIVEYGITDKFTTGAYFLFLKHLSWSAIASTNTPKTEYTGIGDTMLYGRYQFYNGGSLLLSGELVFGIPTGNSTQADLLLTGDGEYNFMPKFAAAYMFGTFGQPSFINTSIGYNKRTIGFSDELHFNFTYGIAVIKNLFLMANVNILQSLKNGDTSTLNGSVLFANNFSFYSYGASIAYNLTTRQTLSFSYRTALGGENIIAAPVFDVGYFIALDL